MDSLEVAARRGKKKNYRVVVKKEKKWSEHNSVYVRPPTLLERLFMLNSILFLSQQQQQQPRGFCFCLRLSFSHLRCWLTRSVDRWCIEENKNKKIRVLFFNCSWWTENKNIISRGEDKKEVKRLKVSASGGKKRKFPLLFFILH